MDPTGEEATMIEDTGDIWLSRALMALAVLLAVLAWTWLTGNLFL